MDQIGKHISSLLFRFDCVIVPELGGFVTNYATAKIHPAQHIFNPPSKNIVFNRNLNNNDGLLANEISKETGTSYSNAVSQITLFVRKALQMLNSGERVVLAEVGTLYLDVEKNIQFEPSSEVNYLTESYGLPQFTSAAILRDYQKRRETEFRDREVVPAKKPVKIRKYVLLTLAAAALVTAVWIPVKTDLLKGIDYAGLNPFGKKQLSKYITTSATEKSFEEYSEETFFLNDTASVFAMRLTDGEGEILVKETPAPVETEVVEENILPTEIPAPVAEIKSAVITKSAGDGMYHIIAGAFEVPENADNFVVKLKENGFDAYILDNVNSRLKHVAIGSFSSHNNASAELQRIRSASPEAWLLRK